MTTAYCVRRIHFLVLLNKVVALGFELLLCANLTSVQSLPIVRIDGLW